MALVRPLMGTHSILRQFLPVKFPQRVSAGGEEFWKVIPCLVPHFQRVPFLLRIAESMAIHDPVSGGRRWIHSGPCSVGTFAPVNSGGRKTKGTSSQMPRGGPGH